MDIPSSLKCLKKKHPIRISGGIRPQKRVEIEVYNVLFSLAKNDILNIVDKSGTKLEVQGMNRNKESDKISI